MFLISLTAWTEELQVFTFQEDGVASESSVAMYEGELSLSRHVYSLTFCMRFKIFFLQQRGTIFFLQDTAKDRFWMLRGGV